MKSANLPLLHSRADGAPGAPVLVLLHSIATTSEIWSAQAAVWSTRWHVIRIDLPGHGQSPTLPGEPRLADYARAVVDVLDAAGLKQCAMLGLSLGGMVAQAFAIAYPQRLRALVLAHTSAKTIPAVRDIWEQRLAQLTIDGMEGQVAPTLERWFTRDFAASAPLTLDWVGTQIRHTPEGGYRAAVRAIQQLDHLEQLALISTPTLVIAGSADTAAPPALSQQMCDHLQRSELVVLDGAAHMGAIQQPVAFAENVAHFLSRLD